METSRASTPWELSAPESFVLLNGPSAKGAEAFKLGVLELVTRNALRIVNVEERGMLERRKQTAVLVEGAGGSVPDGRALRSIWELYQEQRQRAYTDGTVGVPVADLARAAARRYKDIGTYVEREVLPPLVDQGLYAREERRTLGLFRSMRYTLTPGGHAARADLQSRIDLANREFGGWVRGEPARAMAFAGLAGAALLLMPALYPELQFLGERLRQAQGLDPETSSGYVSSSTPIPPAEERERRPDEEREPQPGEEAGQEAGGLDVGGLDVGSLNLGGLGVSGLSSLDFSAFDSIGDAFSAIDAGVDSGGDGGGGGGGD